LHIVCCIKQVPDTADIKIDPDTNTLVRSGVESIANPYDMVALEAAVRLKEAHGGLLTAISMGPPQAQEVLREAISMGADQGVLLSDRAFAGADTLATAYTLAKAIERLNAQRQVELVFCGKQAIDGDTAQTGPGIATRLNFHLLTYVVEIRKFDPSEGLIEVARKLDEGVEVMGCPLPALITAELELAKPRRTSLKRIIDSLDAPLIQWGLEDIDADPSQVGLKGSPTWVKGIFAPPMKAGGPTFDATADPQRAVREALDLLWQDRDIARQLSSGRWDSYAPQAQGD
jgi:electron transfer flavoprotein beta subunit